ncbi:MAG: 3-keto-5-aminohexanoate cleavage protein [Eubacteriales bacterium]
MNRIIVNFAPNGLIPTKEQNISVPVTVKEIVNDVIMANGLGITMVHIHARDEISGEATYKKETYKRIINGIREKIPELVICVSKSGRKFSEFGQRSEVLELSGDDKPDMASLTLSSLNFNNQASINEPEIIARLLDKMNENHIKPELEVFDLGMINYSKYLITKKLLEPPFYFNLILGSIACAQVDLLHIGALTNSLPESSIFSIGGIGKSQRKANALSAAMGYGVRIGLEDNLWYDEERIILATNETLLKRLHVIIKANESKVLTSAELKIELMI